MQPGFFCNSVARLLCSLLSSFLTTLWSSLLSCCLLSSSFLTALWSSLLCCCLLSSSFLLTTLRSSSLYSSFLTTTLWCCSLSSSFLTTLCSHVDFLSERSDPSPNLFRANRDSYYENFPLFCVKKPPACRNSFFEKNVHLEFFG
jgi:hypothetical protein